MQERQSWKARSREIYTRAGRQSRKDGRPITACPAFKRSESDTYGTWLELQWRQGWLRQDDELRQLALFQEENKRP